MRCGLVVLPTTSSSGMLGAMEPNVSRCCCCPRPHPGGIHRLTVEGIVYCDTCRAGFVTTVTEYVPDAMAKIECHNSTTNKLTLEREGVTDASGTYRIMVPNDHEDDTCEVVLVSSPMEGCQEAKKTINRARILLTNNNGISSEIRYANPSGFLKDKPLPCCAELLVKYIMSDEAAF